MIQEMMRRRAVLCGGGAVAFEALLSSLLGGAAPARAEALAGPVPEVDRVAVRVVVDAYQIAVTTGAKAEGVEINRFGWGIGDHVLTLAVLEEADSGDRRDPAASAAGS